MSLLTSPGLTSTPSTASVTAPSDYYAPYISNMLSNTQALANAPMPAYTGQLTAGPSDLQTQAWQGLSNLTLPSQMSQASGNLQNISGAAQTAYIDPNTVQQYMNPYIQSSLAPQLQLAEQQYGQQGAAEQGAATSAGAFGGSREALMQGLNQQNKNLAENQLISSGFNTGYNNAAQMATQNAQLGLQGLQAATSANQAMGNIGTNMAQYNLADLQALAGAGATQQQQQQNALTAQYNQYLRQLQYPQTMAALMSSELSGLQPSSTYTYGAMPSGLQQLASGISGIGNLAQGIFGNNGIMSLFGNNTPANGSLNTSYVPTTGQSVSTGQISYDSNGNPLGTYDANGNLIPFGG